MKRLAISFVSILALSIAAGGCSSCKKGAKKLDEAKKDLVEKKKVVETPLPEEALGELVIKDPESLVKKSADGAGLGPMVGDSPYQKLIDSVTDENAKKALKAIDPHGTFAAVLIAKIAPNEKPHGCAAAKLKDPDIAATALAAAGKSGGTMKTWQSKALDVIVYEPGTDGEVAVYGDAVIIADTREALESGAKYVAWRALESKVDHELVLRVPMQKIGPTLKALGTTEWAKVTPKDLGSPKVKAEIDPLVDPVLTGLADMGEILVNLDIKGDAMELDEKVAATKTLSAWLAKYPAGDATALLTMPKGESASLYRFPDGLGPAIYAGIDYALESSPLTPAERTDASKSVRDLGKSLGHQLAYVTESGKGGTGLNTEVLVRIDLDDAAAAKGAIPTLRKHAEKAAGGKATVTPYTKFGAEGETVLTGALLPSPGSAGTPTKDTWTWALKGTQLWLSACLGCTPTLLDAALDPGSKATLESDPAAKAKIGEFPTKGLITASYGTTFSMPGAFGGLSAFMGAPPPGPKKPGVAMWGWSTTAADGVTAKGVVPLVFLGDLVKGYLAMTMGGMGMGGSPPPF
ncbi:MAG: hypothetical protein ACXWUG_09495 [Polyangiales bacterium]